MHIHCIKKMVTSIHIELRTRVMVNVQASNFVLIIQLVTLKAARIMMLKYIIYYTLVPRDVFFFAIIFAMYVSFPRYVLLIKTLRDLLYTCTFSPLKSFF